jgi:hypothetical protein
MTSRGHGQEVTIVKDETATAEDRCYAAFLGGIEQAPPTDEHHIPVIMSAKPCKYLKANLICNDQ